MSLFLVECDNPCLLSENVKRVKLEKQLKDAKKCLREVTNQVTTLEKSAKRLTASMKPTKHGGKSRKAWVSCSKQYQRRKRRQVTSDVRTAVVSMEDEPFHVISIELTNKETGDITTIDESGKKTMSAEGDIMGKTLYEV